MSLLDVLTDQLSGEPAARIGDQLGTDQAGAQQAIQTALPALMAALAGNATRRGGAEALAGALDRDHDGGILDDLSGFLGRGETGDGKGILRHALGAQLPAVETQVAQQTGLKTDAIGKLLPLLAPIVMGALAKEKSQRGLDANGLAGLLSGEGERAREMAPDALGIVGSLLDSEGDGLDAGDVADVGKKLLGGFLRKRQ